MKPTLFLSDLHFHGDHTPGGRALLDVLDQARGEAEAVYLVGDVFDFWLGYRTTLYRACFPLLRRLAALVDAGTAVHLFTGNHDPEHGDFFGDIGVTVHDGPHTARIGGHTVWLEHGDLIDPRGLHHRLVCRVARHPWLHRAARLAPPAALWAVARAYARRGEHTYDEPLPAALLDAYLPARAREGADVVVMGHYHRAVVHTRQVDGRTVRFFGLGDWVKQRTWLRFDGDFTLLRYQDGGPPVALPEGITPRRPDPPDLVSRPLLGFSCAQPETRGVPLHRLAYMVPILLAVWFFDAWITDDGRAGWERNTVRNSVARFENDTRGRVAIMGSSTSKDWLSERTLEGLLGRKRGEVIDAHINGCHQGCTWAEVQKIRQLHHQKRCRPSGKDRCSPPTEKRFDAVFFGTNLFQLCEFAHSKRVLQHAMLTPVADVPALFGRYLHADQPLQWIGRYAGIRLSDAYGDTQALRDYWGRRFLGSPRAGKAHAWYRADAPAGDAAPLSCAYDADAVALKRAFTEGLLDDLGELADHVYLMLLPDRSRALDDPEHRRRWAAHLALHQAIADARPWVTVVDLVTDGAARPEHFRDGFHLNEAGMTIQQALFAARLKALGVAKP